jgi:tetratricopeptide (TPR) repeat protein
VLALSWEKKRIPIPIKVDTNAIVVASLKQELHSSRGFQYQAWVEASNYLMENNIELPLALEWAQFAISGPFTGERTFGTLSNKADILEKMGRSAEASAVMDEAMKIGTAAEVHQYGRAQLARHNTERSLAVFKLNAQLHPDAWPVNYGLARGYSAVGDYKSALEALVKAQAQVPAGDTVNAGAIKANIEKLKKGLDIN